MTIPDLSTTGTTVKVINWLVEIGQPVKRGQPLLEVETDKATMEVEAYMTGILKEILAPPDTDVEVGQVIAIIETQDESLPASKPIVESALSSSTQAPAPTAAPTPESRPMGMFARNRQKTVQGPQEIQRPRSLTLNQRVVAQRMLESKQTIPHFYLQTSANAEPMMARRSAAPGERPVWDAFFVYAVGKALKNYARLCVSFRDGQLIQQGVDAVGVAVDLDGELYVIQILNPASKSPEQISSDIRGGVQRLQEGDPDARKIHTANITISNLGAAGIEGFTAVINPPEAAILAVGKIGPSVIATDGQVVVQNRVSLTLSVDHRIVNGRYAAEFLQAIVDELESL
jgi:pyruvate dehydrogenase E2 component (dihydrolipoamide acetyltransferase)